MKTEEIINSWASAQKSGAFLPCPRCGQMRMHNNLYENAFSRRAILYICSSCGSEEAMEDDRGTAYKLPVEGWFLCKTVFSQPYQEKHDDGSYSFEATQEITIQKRDIEAILSTAFEGSATTAWCAGIEMDNPLSSYASEHIAHGGTAILFDNEGDKATLDAGMVARGIQQWYQDGHDTCGAVSCGEIDTSEIDDEAADAIVQYALFGEIIYG